MKISILTFVVQETHIYDTTGMGYLHSNPHNVKYRHRCYDVKYCDTCPHRCV